MNCTKNDRIYMDLLKDEDKKIVPVPVWRLPASGYGKKVPTQHMIRIDNRWYRVYCMIYSNAGSCYIVKNKKKIFVD